MGSPQGDGRTFGGSAVANTIREEAQRLIDDGWSVVPLPAGQKAATGPWNVTTYSADDITDGVAAKCGAPSGDRVCVDHDVPAAVVASSILLPRTRLEGRSGRPNSHAWFICPDAKHRSFRSLKNSRNEQPTIIEILATNQYAAIPPSVHPTGELREWMNDEPLLKIPFADLQEAVRDIAIACLVAEHFPGSGARHDARLALAGFLQRAGVHNGAIRQIGSAVELIIGGDENDWNLACTSTLGMSTGPKTGGPKLAERLERGDEVLALLNKWLGRKEVSKRALRFTTADTITPQPVRWIWDERMPAGSFGLLAGREGLGKSLTALSIVARLTRGTLQGIHYGHPKAAIITATEDSWAHVIAPRLRAADADLSRVIRVEAETPEGFVEVSLPVDLEALQQAVIERDVALMVLDPLISRLDGKLDTHKDAEVRRALEPIVKLADATGLSVLGIIHVNKSSTTDPLNSVMGSRAFSAVSRYVLFVVEDPNDHSVRLFGQPKNNLGPSNQNTLTFEVEDRYVMTAATGESIHAGRVSWTGQDPRTIREILQEAQTIKAPTAGGDAARWLKQYLTQHGGCAESSLVKSEATVAGHHTRAVQRAAKKLHVSFHPKGMPARVWWVLPGTQAPLSAATP